MNCDGNTPAKHRENKPEKICQSLAKQKSIKTSLKYTTHLVLGADTCLIYKKSFLSKPKTKEALTRIRKLSDKHHERYSDEWLDIITKALETLPEFQFEKAERLEPHLEKLHNLLNLYTKQAADDLRISPKLLASSAEITAFLQNKYDDFMHDWRFDIYGQYLSKIINGEVYIKYSKDKMKIILEYN